MARKPRLDLAGVPQHIIQRGNNRDICFAADEDYIFYAHCLLEASQKYGVSVHAWVFMTNHVHLLVTPAAKGAVSKMMQSIGRRYVQYFNHTYRRTGTLWEGRFKSCLVDSEHYLLECYRYIELNPVRAGMVDEPSGYRWSSFCVNALGKTSQLCTPHEQYLALGKFPKERLEAYRQLFRHQQDKGMVKNLQDVTQKGLVFGRADFVRRIEFLLDRRLERRNVGRPRQCIGQRN